MATKKGVRNGGARDSGKRERLINAAAELFWTGSYAGTSLADIAKSADVPLGNVYYYFKTKRALADDVAALFVQQTRDALAQIEADQSDPVQRVLAFFDLIAGSNEARTQYGCPIAQSIREAALEATGTGASAGEALWLMVDWIDQQARSAGLPDPRERAERAIGAWQGAIVLAQALGEVGVLDHALDGIRRQFVS